MIGNQLYTIYSLVFLPVLLWYPLDIKAFSSEEGPVFSDSLALTVEHRMYTPLAQIDDQRVTDHYLRAFSKSIPRILAYTRFSIHWKHQVYHQEDKLITHTEGFHIRGHHNYRGIDMRPWMLPSHIVLFYKLHHGDTFAIVEDSLPPHQAAVSRLSVPDTLSVSPITRDDLSYKLIYTPGQQEAFSHITQAVDAYYKDYPLVREHLKAIEPLDPENLNMLPIYNARLREVEACLKEMQQRSYHAIPELKEQDPLGFFPPYARLSHDVSSLRESIDYRMEHLDRLYYEQGLSFLSQDTAHSRSYFQRSVQLNPNYSTAWLALARLDIKAEKPAQAAKKVEKILTQLKPDTLTYRKTLELADTLAMVFVEKGKEYMDKSDYNKAVSTMERAAQYCQNTPGYQCPEAVDKHLTLARYGIYNAYISVAQRAMSRKRPQLALEYIRMADTFQQKHSNAIISNKEVRDLYDQVTSLFAREALSYKRSGEYDKALALLKDAFELCHSDECREKANRQMATARQGIYMDNLLRSRDFLLKDNITGATLFLTQASDYLQAHDEMVSRYPLQDSLEQAVYSIRYGDLLEEAESHLGKGNRDQALSALVMADSLLNIYAFETNDTLVPLIRQLARPKVMRLAQQIRHNLQLKDYQEVPEQLQQLNNVLSGYYLKGDQELTVMADSLEQHFTQLICQPVKEQFEQLHRQAGIRIVQARYEAAQQFYLQALDTARAHPHCQIDTSAIKQTLEQKQAVFHYATMEQELDKAFEEKNFPLVVQLITEMEQYYERNELEKENITLVRPVAFAREKSHKDLLLFMTNHYLESGRETEALQIFKGLEQKIIPPRVSRRMQRQLAAALATRDTRTGIDAHYRDQAETYSNNAYWLRHLERYYKTYYRRKQRIFPWVF